MVVYVYVYNNSSDTNPVGTRTSELNRFVNNFR